MRKRAVGVPNAEKLRAEFEAAWAEALAGPQTHRLVMLPPSPEQRPTRAGRRLKRMRAHTSRSLEVTKRHVQARWTRILNWGWHAGIVSPAELRADLGLPELPRLDAEEIAHKLAEGDITINQARAAMGYPPLGPVGDETTPRRPDNLAEALSFTDAHFNPRLLGWAPEVKLSPPEPVYGVPVIVPPVLSWPESKSRAWPWRRPSWMPNPVPREDLVLIVAMALILSVAAALLITF
jgi:hypothetical protein